MILRATTTHPSQRSYVLKLHRDADPGAGRLSGRLEHIASGEHVDFASAAELLDWLARHAATVPEPGYSASPANGPGDPW